MLLELLITVLILIALVNISHMPMTEGLTQKAAGNMMSRKYRENDNPIMNAPLDSKRFLDNFNTQSYFA